MLFVVFPSAVSAEMHHDLCSGVLLRRPGGAHLLSRGHLG